MFIKSFYLPSLYQKAVNKSGFRFNFKIEKYRALKNFFPKFDNEKIEPISELIDLDGNKLKVFGERKFEAQYENGVLTLVLPKIEVAKARKIKIGENAGLLDRVFGKKPDLKTSA
jgi:hypothetical protein